MYPGQMWPTSPCPLLIEPSPTEPYYTMSVWHVEEWRHTQVRCTHPTNWTQCYRVLLHRVSLICEKMQMYPGQIYTHCSLNPVLQSCTTPCQFDMWKNADVLRSDVNPYPDNRTQCSYRSLLHHVSLTCGRMQTYPSQMYTPTNWTQCYRALLHHVSLTCGRMKTYSGQMYTPH